MLILWCLILLWCVLCDGCVCCVCVVEYCLLIDCLSVM